MHELINENTKIEDIKTLPSSIKEKFTPYFVAISDLLEKSVEDLTSLKGITLLDVAVIVKFLNIYNLHLNGEEIAVLEEFWKPETSELMKKYNEKIARRNIVYQKMETDSQNTFQYAKEAHVLENEIEELLTRLEEVRDSSSRRK